MSVINSIKGSLRPLVFILSLAVSLQSVFTPWVALAADPSPSPSPTASPTYGPQTLVGPTGPVGPQGPIGPQGPLGPQPDPTPSPTPSVSPAAASSAGSSDGSTTTNTGSTGPNSNNQTSVKQNNTANLNDRSDATISKNITGNFNTGDNTAGEATGSIGQKSGDINTSITVLNLANSGGLDGSTASAQSFGNHQGNVSVGAGKTVDLATGSTGPSSNNLTQVDKNTAVQVNLEKDADVTNNINLFGNTGRNEAFNTSGNIDQETGKFNANLNLINVLNLDSPIHLDIMNLYGSLVGDILFPDQMLASSLQQTGPNSNNQHKLNVNHDLNLTEIENADIANNLAYDLNTGGNTASDSTGGIELESGKINVQAVVNNIANAPANMLYLINVYGECSCDVSALDPDKYVFNLVPSNNGIEATTGQTGPGSNNQTNVNKNTDIDITKVSNGSVTNNINVQANTGHNSAHDATGKIKVKTGDINIMTQIANLVNTKAKQGQKLVLGIINIFGLWQGKATGATQPVVNQAAAVPAVQSVANNQNVVAPAAAIQNANSGAGSTSQSTSTQTTTTAAAVNPVVPSPIQVAIVPAFAQPQGLNQAFQTWQSPVTGQTVSQQSQQNQTLVAAQSQDSSTPPSAGAGSLWQPWNNFFGQFIASAQAATKGSIPADKLPYLNLLLIPLGIWLAAEVILGIAARRQRKQTSSSI